MRYANWRDGVWRVFWDLDGSGETKEEQKLNCWLKSGGDGVGNWPLASFSYPEVKIIVAHTDTLEAAMPPEYRANGEIPERHALLHWMRAWLQDVDNYRFDNEGGESGKEASEASG